MKNSFKWMIAVTATLIAVVAVVMWIFVDGLDKGKFITFVLLVIATNIGLKTGEKERYNEQSSGSEDL